MDKLRLKSRVLSNKKYLVNDPVVLGMNDTQWLFEFESYVQSQDSRYEEYKVVLEAWKGMLINLLGLNLMPIEEEEDGRLRMPTQDEIMPLSLIAGREEVVASISKKLEDYRAQSEVDAQVETEEDMSIEEFEELLPDMMFPEDPEDLRKFLIQNDPATKRIMESWVLPLEPVSEDVVKSNIEEKRNVKKSRLKIE